MAECPQDITEQLMKFGWTKEECLSAFGYLSHNVSPTVDINDVLNILIAVQNQVPIDHDSSDQKEEIDVHDKFTYSMNHHDYHSNNNLLIFGYIRNKYEDRYNQLIPLDIKLLCSDYRGYKLCCIATTKCGQQRRKDKDESHRVEGTKAFFKQIEISHTLNTIRRDNIVVIRALFASIISKHMACFEYLLHARIWKKPLLITQTDSYSPIHSATYVKNIAVVQRFIETPFVDIDQATGIRHRSALSIACYNGHIETIKLLLANDVCFIIL